MTTRGTGVDKEFRSDAHEIALMMPQLIQGLQSQRDVLAGLQSQQAETAQILKSLTHDLSIVKEDRVKEDRRIEERVLNLESRTSTPVTQMVSMLGSAVAMAVPLGLLIWFGIGGQITSVRDSLTRDIVSVSERVGQIYDRHTEHTADGHPPRVEARVDSIKAQLEDQINSTKERFDRREDRMEEDFREVRTRLQELEKRTGVLFKGGNPY